MNGAAITRIEGKDATLDELKQFSAVPFHIPWYRSRDSNKVFPWFLSDVGDLNASQPFLRGVIEKNPFFDHAEITYLIARKGSTPVGRIASVVDHRYNEENNQNAGWISMPEFIEDPYTAEQLINEACSTLLYKGCDKAIGPAKFNANGEVGLLIDGFDKKPYFMEGYNAPYYQEYFEDFGFVKQNDWYSIHGDTSRNSKFIDTMAKTESRIMLAKNSASERMKLMREAVIRPISFSDFEMEVGILKELYNGEWGKGNHPQFVTMTHDEMDALANGIKLIALEELVLVAELDGKPIGISATVPNINEVIAAYDRKRPDYLPSPKFLSPKDLARDMSILAKTKQKLSEKRFDSLRVLILGVKEEHRAKGIEALLMYNTYRAAEKMGVTQSSFSELADINTDIVTLLDSYGERAMTWRVYSLDL